MRIALLSLEKGGGLAHYAYELAKAMTDVADVTCFIVQNEILSEFQDLRCQVRVFPFSRGPRALVISTFTGRNTAAIAQAIRAHNPDVVIDAGSGSWGGLVLKHLIGRIPIAQIVHDVDPHPDLRSMIAALPTMVRGPVADVFVGLSNFSSGELRRKYPRTPCLQTKLGLLLAAREVDTAQVAALRYKQLLFGRIHPYKGVDTLVDAFAIARKAEPRLQLTIAGPGRLRPGLEKRILALDIALDNRYLSDGEVRQIIKSHGVMLLPYTSATQSGVASLALANGMACVATSVGGLTEQVIDGRNGLVVPPHSPEALARAMVAVSRDAAVARSMAEESLRIGREQYSWPAIGQRLVEDLEKWLAA